MCIHNHLTLEIVQVLSVKVARTSMEILGRPCIQCVYFTWILEGWWFPCFLFFLVVLFCFFFIIFVLRMVLPSLSLLALRIPRRAGKTSRLFSSAFLFSHELEWPLALERPSLRYDDDGPWRNIGRPVENHSRLCLRTRGFRFLSPEVKTNI